jgi:hypothetical protein
MKAPVERPQRTKAHVERPKRKTTTAFPAAFLRSGEILAQTQEKRRHPPRLTCVVVIPAPPS